MSLGVTDESQRCIMNTWTKEGKTKTTNKRERQRDMTGAGSKQTQSWCENQRADKKLLVSLKPPRVYHMIAHVPSFYVRRGHRAASLGAGSHYQLAR